MILGLDETEVIGVESTDFKILSSSKAFKILGDSLYQHKHEAVIRELSTNALDSQKEAGYGGKFDLYIPTNLNPEFLIRDYGTGLDAKQIEGLYTTYFQSTKENTNEYIGALGLGSKSPFSCTDEFTVTSYKDQMMYVYFIKIVNEVPSYAKLVEQPTDQPNGLEIKFYSEDCHEFRKAYQKVISGFDKEFRPNCNIELDFELREIFKGSGIYESLHGQHDRINIRMGQIVYPIGRKAEDYFKRVGSYAYRIVIDVPLGSVDIHPSRESLDFTPRTQEYVDNTITKTIQLLKEMTQREVDQCQTIREASKILDKMRLDYSEFTFKGESMGVLNEDFRSLINATFRMGQISTYRAKELISPRLTYVNKFRYSFNSDIILVVRSKKINIAHTLKYLGFLYNNKTIIFVEEENKEVIELIKRVYREDLILYNTNDSDLHEKIKKYRPNRNKGNNLVRVINFTKSGSSIEQREREVDRNDIENLPNTFTGTRRGRYITITSRADDSDIITIEQNLNYYRYNQGIVGIIYNLYGEFNIVLGVNNAKYAESKNEELFKKLLSGGFTTKTDNEVDLWIELGFELGRPISLSISRNGISNSIIDKISKKCLYTEVEQEEALSSFMVEYICYIQNSSKRDKIIKELKGLLCKR